MNKSALFGVMLFFGLILFSGCAQEEPTGKAVGEETSLETCEPHWECFSSGAKQKVYSDCSKGLPQACPTNLCCGGYCQVAECYNDSDCSDGNESTADQCVSPGTCNAQCQNTA